MSLSFASIACGSRCCSSGGKHYQTGRPAAHVSAPSLSALPALVITAPPPPAQHCRSLHHVQVLKHSLIHPRTQCLRGAPVVCITNNNIFIERHHVTTLLWVASSCCTVSIAAPSCLCAACSSESFTPSAHVKDSTCCCSRSACSADRSIAACCCVLRWKLSSRAV